MSRDTGLFRLKLGKSQAKRDCDSPQPEVFFPVFVNVKCHASEMTKSTPLTSGLTMS